MSEGILSNFLDGAGNRLYRELVQSHIRKLSTQKLQQAVVLETSNLPENIRTEIVPFIDAINERFAYDNDFWKETTCIEAFKSFMLAAFEFLPINDQIKSIEESFGSENQEIAFQIFQITTLSFAYSASTQKKQQKFMGI